MSSINIDQNTSEQVCQYKFLVKMLERDWMSMRSAAWNERKLLSNCRSEKPFHGHEPL